MFELGREAAAAGDRGPAVVEDLGAASTWGAPSASRERSVDFLGIVRRNVAGLAGSG
jgi:hypothetical protein